MLKTFVGYFITYRSQTSMQSYQLKGSLSSKDKESFLAGHFSLILLQLL